MSSDPDWDVDLADPRHAALRVQRDVALQIPINHVTVPGVSLRAACFAHNQYGVGPFQKCLQTLLQSGFKRLLVDVYWDSGRGTWSLCPVSLSPSGSASTSHTRRDVENSRDVEHHSRAPFGGGFLVLPRQESSSLTSVLSSESTETTAASSMSYLTSSAFPPAPTLRPSNSTSDEAPGPVQIGPYNCTSTMTLSLLTNLLKHHLDDTGTTLEASLIYLILKIHAAAPLGHPGAPGEQPSTNQLPSPNNQLSDVIKGNLSDYLYTPHQLQSDRKNLDDTWLDVPASNQPAQGYYRTLRENNNLMTADGWPALSYAVFKEFDRLLVGLGSIDAQMRGYDFSAELGTIFDVGVLVTFRNTTFDGSGEIQTGCLYNRDQQNPLSSDGSSWAVSVGPRIDIGQEPDINLAIPSVANLTHCAISPLLNSTLANATADTNPLPYLAFTHSTIWSWAPGEPLNTTSDDDTGRNRCAAISLSPAPGHWRTIDCHSERRVACQHNNEPYRWIVSDTTVRYSSGPRVCPSNTTFSVPHTAMENAHLLSELQSGSIGAEEAVYLNINSLDVKNCWATGVNSTCPYAPTNDTDKVRIVVVPTVAAVIVFVLAALTFFVKCASNRREAKRGRRRRNVGGWDYEGVPS